jgi:signal transduction histidine kinase
MNIHIVFVCLVMVGSRAMSSPSQIDSLENLLTTATGTERINVLNSLAYRLGMKSPERCIELAGEALELAEEVADQSGIYDAYRALAKGYHFSNDPTAALSYHQKALALARSLGRHRDVPYTMLLMGNEYFSRQDYDNALKWYLESLQHSESVRNEEMYSHAANSIGSVYLRLYDFEKAIEYYEIARETSEQIDDTRGIANALNNIGIIYDEHLQEFDKALDYYEKALVLFKQTNDNEGEAYCLNNIGLIYVRFKEFDKALEYFNSCLEISLEENDQWSVGNTHNNIGRVYSEKGDYLRGREYAERALNTAREIGTKDIARDAHLTLSRIEQKRGNAARALEHFKEHVAVKDSIFNEERSRQIAEMQTKYETEKKEREIEILRKEGAIQALELNKQRNIRNFLIVCSALVLVLGVVIYNRYVLKKRTNALLEQKNRELEAANLKLQRSEADLTELNATKDRFFSIIAHDLKNPMNTFLGFSELLSDSYGELKEAQIREFIEIIHKSAKHLFSLLENLLQWSRSQTGRMILKPQHVDVMNAVAADLPLLAATAEKKSIQFKAEIERGTVVYADPRMVATVIRNLLSNAIKYTKSGGEVRMVSRETGEFVEISVIDSGIGISSSDQKKLFRIDVHHTTAGTADERGTGLGLILCKDFVEKSGGSIRVESEEGKGSTFAFTLPKAS